MYTKRVTYVERQLVQYQTTVESWELKVAAGEREVERLKAVVDRNGFFIVLHYFLHLRFLVSLIIFALKFIETKSK